MSDPRTRLQSVGLACTLLGEPLGAQQLLGVALVIGGVRLVAVGDL